MQRLRAAVIGAGYLGRFHAQKYAALPDVDLCAVVDLIEERALEVAAPSQAQALTDYRRILDVVDVASVVVPPESHYAVAKDCLAAGVHVLVEKPMTRTLAEADELIALARRQGLVLQVGHLERFNPALLALRGILHQPMFIESHRIASFQPRGAGVSVVMDLMIHDIDIILNIVASAVAAIRPMGLSVLTAEVDIANARLEFADGCIANVTASRVS
ncbi:MAG: Gfo/Idh/MocA family protein, partial [Gammaproteobacteria bacterium]